MSPGKTSNVVVLPDITWNRVLTFQSKLFDPNARSKLNGNKQVTSNGQNKPQFVPKTDAHVESGNINSTPQQFEQLLRSMQPIRTDVDAEVGITCLNSQLDELELLEDWI
ncbi:hypothetical protein Tco_0292965 [Tanacetum coccineum]